MKNMRTGETSRRLTFTLGAIVAGLAVLLPRLGWAQVPAQLENPRPGSFQSGIGVINGWVCEAEEVVIEINGTPVRAAYGTTRRDTQMPSGPCADDLTGFGLTVNWNLFGDGVQMVRALADGVEFGRAAVTVTTLGLDDEFPRGLSRSVQVANFPQAGANTQVQWQESQQNFVIGSGNPEGGGNSETAGIQALLEDPRPGSFQSGIGVIRGWVCEAEEVVIEINGTPIQAAYGTTRRDTQMPLGPCAGENTGFGLTFNWNLVGAGLHRVRALADGVAFADVTFTVTTLGLGEFPEGLSGSAQVGNFPQGGTGMRLQWQESQQNFPLAGAFPPGVDAATQCTTLQGMATDPAGGQAITTWTNACLLLGNTMLAKIQSLGAGANTALSDPALRGQSAGGFFLCGDSLGFSQEDQVFGSSEFTVFDSAGNEICEEIPPGTEIDILVRIEEGSPLNFNIPFGIRYAGGSVVSFRPPSPPQCQVSVSPTPLDFGMVAVGGSRDLTFQVTNTGASGADTLVGNVSIGSNPDFSIVSGETLNLAPGQSQIVTVRFTPSEAGMMNGSITVNSNCGVALVALSGIGTAAPRLAVSPDVLDFGEVPQNTRRTLNLTITNVGGGTLSGDSVFFFEGTVTGTGGGPFRPLGPGESENFEFFVDAGTNLGPFSGSVDITSNGGSASVPISGTVVEGDIIF